MSLFGGILRTAGLFKVGDYYYFNDPNNAEINDWRFFENGIYLDLEKYNGSIWIQEFRFGIPYVTTETDQSITGTKTFDSFKFNLTSGVVCEEGAVSWNPDAGTTQRGMPGGSVCLQDGQELFLPRATNKSGDTIINGTPVYISGAAGTNLFMDVADASDPDNNRKTIAIATETIENDQKGFFTISGTVRDVDTDGFPEGSELFVAVGGGFTNIKPDLPNGITRVGFCTREHQDEGQIVVSIDTKSIKDILTDSGDLTIKTATGYTAVLEKPVYKDINLGAALFSTPAVSKPDQDTFRDNTGTDTGIVTYAFAPGEKLHGSFEIQHDYKEGTNLNPHLHFQIIDAPTGIDKVKWQLTYTFTQSPEEVSPQILPATTATTFEIDVDTQYGFYVNGFPEIDGTNIKIGSQFVFTLERIAASADEFAGDALISTFGIHILLDTLGSRQKFLK
jgi:hypothetical protein